MREPFAPGLAPEDRLLLLSARSEPDEQALAAISALSMRPLDWSYIRSAAVRHGVAPLVSAALERAEQVAQLGVPDDVRSELRRLHEVSASRSRRLYSTVRQVVEAFASESIDVVGLKDLGLALTAYPEVGLRPIGDLDLLIHRENYDRAAAGLRALGFESHPHDPSYQLLYGMGQHFRRASDDVWVDLQWNVAQREWDLYGAGLFSYEPERIWDNRVPVDAGGWQLLVPAPEEMLFHLALHAEGHTYGELILFSDIAELLRAEGERLDWDRIVARVRDAGCESSVYHVLVMTQLLLGAHVPRSVLGQLEPAYFGGTLYEPLFGNLAALHETLDDVRIAAAPPPEVVERFEEVVRGQVALALAAQHELLAIASSVSGAGARFIGFLGERPERNVPVGSLAPFQKIELLVAGTEASRVGEILGELGFGRDRGSGRMHKSVPIQSDDPALCNRQLSLRLDVEVSASPLAEPTEPGGRSLAGSARVRALRTQILRRAPARAEECMNLEVHVLGEEAIAAGLARRLAARPVGRLFAAVDLVRLLRSETLDAGRMAALLGDDHEAVATLRLAASVASATDVLVDLPVAGAPPRLLERARVGAAGAEHESLRDAYYSLLAFLSADWPLRRALFKRDFRPGMLGAKLRPLAYDVAALARERLGRGQSAERESFWVEP